MRKGILQTVGLSLLLVVYGMVAGYRTQDTLEARAFLQGQLAGQIRWLSVNEALELPLGCIDGRQSAAQTTRTVPSMLGGSAGEAMRHLAAYLALVPAERRGQVVRMLCTRMDEIHATVHEVAPVVVHSDEHAHGDRLGCGYLNLLAQDPERFGLVSSDLVRTFVEVARQRRTKTDDFTLLHGEHREVGVLVVHARGDLVPALVPNMGTEYFVYVPELEAALRQELSGVLLPLFNTLTGEKVAEADFSLELGEVTQQHVAEALRALAPGKPVFDVYLSKEKGLIDITQR